MAQNAGPDGPEENQNEQREAGQENQPTAVGDDERESIWTIPAKLKRWYFALFSIQVVIATVWLVRTAIANESREGVADILFYVWQYMAPAAVSSATFALVIVDTVYGIMVLSTWLEDELKKRRARQIKAAVEIAEERGLARGRAELQREWENWNRRREAAAATGEEFTELPPSATVTETQEPEQN